LNEAGVVSIPGSLNAELCFDLVFLQENHDGIAGRNYSYGRLRFKNHVEETVMSRLLFNSRLILTSGGIKTALCMYNLNSFKAVGNIEIIRNEVAESAAQPRARQHRNTYEARSRSCSPGFDSSIPFRNRFRSSWLAHIPGRPSGLATSKLDTTNEKPTPSTPVRTTVDKTVSADAKSSFPVSVLCKVTGISVPGSQRSRVTM
jgi:hypothetical protein